MARLFLGELPLRFLPGPNHRRDHDEEREDSQRDVPVLNCEADKQHEPEDAPASARLLLDDYADRLLLRHCGLSSRSEPGRRWRHRLAPRTPRSMWRAAICRWSHERAVT